MSYDIRCRDIAMVFLSDEPGFKDLPEMQRNALADELAQDVQDQIEASLEAFRDNGRFE
jgi:hypothetical protein